jgi:tetratricopeptide (TPR) repeat protein
LSGYFLGEIDRGQAHTYGRHIETCSRCRNILREMEQEATALARDDPLRSGERSTVRAWLEWLRAVVQPMPAPALVAASVVACLAFVAGLLVGPALVGRGQSSPEVRIAKPPFTPSAESPALGVAPSVKPEAEQRFREAMTFHGQSDFADLAIPKLKQAVALDPRHEQAQFWLGTAYLLKGQAAAAVPALEEAVRLAPGKVQYKQYLIWAYLMVGKSREALRLQTEVLERGRP